MPSQRSRLGREGDGQAAHHLQSRAFGVATIQQIQGRAGAEVGSADTQAGEPDDVAHPTAQRTPPECAEPAAGVDGPAPAVGDRDVGQLRERVDQMLGQDGECLRVLGATRIGVATQKVEGVVAAEQQPVTPVVSEGVRGGRPPRGVSTGQPVVVEQVARIADPLSPRPTQGGAYVGRERLGHQRVVPDRDHVRLHRAQQRGCGAGGEQDLGGAYGSVGRTHADPGSLASEAGNPGVLMNAYAQALGRRRQAPRQSGRIDHGHAVGVVQAGSIGGRRDLGLDLVGIQPLEVQPVTPAQLVLFGQIRPPASRLSPRPARRCARNRSRCRAGRQRPRWRPGSPHPSGAEWAAPRRNDRPRWPDRA